MDKLAPGLAGEITTVVTEMDTADHWGSGLVPVFGTPALVGLMEGAAVQALAGRLRAEPPSVGGLTSTTWPPRQWACASAPVPNCWRWRDVGWCFTSRRGMRSSRLGEPPTNGSSSMRNGSSRRRKPRSNLPRHEWICSVVYCRPGRHRVSNTQHQVPSTQYRSAGLPVRPANARTAAAIAAKSAQKVLICER
jgi:hypothetical protein